jgi:glutamine amidotransferase
VKGFGLFAGSVPRFNFNGKQSGSGLSAATGRGTKPPPTFQNLKVPHMGWNQLRVRQTGCPLLAGIEDNPYVYFVHSYYCRPNDPDVICGTTDYGGEFCSMLWRGNVFATQFHPEKSQAIGLKMLANFVGLVKCRPTL